MSEHRGWIGVDLDGTLAHYDGWKGADHIGDPVPAMVERVKQWLADGREVRIFTARVSPADPCEYDAVRLAVELWSSAHLGCVLPVTCVKDYGMVELWDDRAVQIVPNTGRPISEPPEPGRFTQVPSGCWVACIAGLTGLSHEALAAFVPQNFGALCQAGTEERELRDVWNAYHNAVNQYLRENGWRYAAIGPDVPRGYAIGIGKSPRNLEHAVIVHDGAVWHDPHPSRDGIEHITSYEVLVPLVRMGN